MHWRCRQCWRFAETALRHAHLWVYHQTITLEESLTRFFEPAWN